MSLDPKDWNDFRTQARRVLDACIDRLEHADQYPWQKVTDEQKQKLAPELSRDGQSYEAIASQLLEDVMPYATGNTHPKFFGWVHGSGLASGLLAEMVAATMNSNCGGRDHGAAYVEACVIDWCKNVFGFPDQANGIVTVGTSQATILALSCARMKLFGNDVRTKGIAALPSLRVYCREGTHSCVAKALEVMGHGSDCVVDIKTECPSGPMNMADLFDKVQKDCEAGLTPLAIVGTAGSVNTGAYDDLESIADFCKAEDIWLHIDGAFGAWSVLADMPFGDLAKGIERADSLAFDFHKWLSVQYDCGAVLIRDGNLHRDTFSMRPSYLAEQAEGLGGGDIWFCDYGTDLSRGFRALKVWTALQTHGLDAFSKSVTGNCEQAHHIAALADKHPRLELAAPIVSNVCVFKVVSDNISQEELDRLNTAIVHHLQNTGQGVFSTTLIEGATVIRAAIVNHRTKIRDIDEIMDAVGDALDHLME